MKFITDFNIKNEKNRKHVVNELQANCLLFVSSCAVSTPPPPIPPRLLPLPKRLTYEAWSPPKWNQGF